VQPDTICDGLLTSLSPRTFAAIEQHVSAILTVSDDAVLAAMRMVFERMKLVVEPSACVGLAALMTRRDEISGRRIGVVFSGGNVDLSKLPF